MYVDLSCFKSDNLSRSSSTRVRMDASLGSRGVWKAGESVILKDASGLRALPCKSVRHLVERVAKSLGTLHFGLLQVDGGKSFDVASISTTNTEPHLR